MKLKIRPRQTGKTTKIAKKYLKIKGDKIIFLSNLRFDKIYREYGITNIQDIKSWKSLLMDKTNLKITIFLDDFLQMDKKALKSFLKFSENHRGIKIYGLTSI